MNNTCIIGEAGTGKTTLIKQRITDNSVIVAPSAVASINAGGNTAHSTFALSPGLQTDADLNRITEDMWGIFGSYSPIDKLVIDEGFNLPADILDGIDHKLKLIRENSNPFGGLDVIVSGDPLQIPAFYSRQDNKVARRKYKSAFIFDSKIWSQANFNVKVLTEIHRQENKDQQEALSCIRSKSGDWKGAVDYINDIITIGDIDPDACLSMSVLRKEVAAINKQYYEGIGGKEYTFKGSSSGIDGRSNLPAPMELKLKLGTKVIFTVNNSTIGFNNGLRGEVIFLSKDTIVVKAENGVEYMVEPHKWEFNKPKLVDGKLVKARKGWFEQYPLRLGYSSTINSAQGLTLDKAYLNLDQPVFGDAMLYVALSRLRDVSNLTASRYIIYDDIKVNQKALDFVNKHK